MPRFDLKKILLGVIFLFYVVFLLECALRAQQAMGPYSDLEPDVDLSVLSDTVNHQRAQGVRILRSAGQNGAAGKPLRVLFMGDSFMEGLSDLENVPRYVWDHFHGFPDRKLEFVNAGCSGYSPLIFIAQFKKLYPAVKPDVVVVMIDETDLRDDWMRYRHLAVRDAGGKVVAVRGTPINDDFLKGLARVNEIPFYSWRFVYKMWHTRIKMPVKIYLYRARHGGRFFPWGRRGDPKKFKEDIRFFSKNVDELIETIFSYGISPDKLILVSHPHLRQLVDQPEDAGKWRKSVKPVLVSAAEKYHVNFYDLTWTFKEKAAGRYGDYYLPKDMHFNAKGLKLYGESLAEFLESSSVF